MDDESRMIFMDIPMTPKLPMSPSTCRDKSPNFFDILTRRFARRSHDDLCYQQNGDEDTRSTSTDSSSSTSERLGIQSKAHSSNLEVSCSSDSSNSSNTSTGESNIQSRHRRSTLSLRRAMQSLTISSRSMSCSGTLQTSDAEKPKKTKKSNQPKKILRQPVTYTYLKGMSGLPTQRVPRSLVCCHYSHR